jgi:hypothetical protein
LASERKSTDAFEAALKREIQSAQPSPEADCPAPDVLAAYYDRSLSRSERARVDAHLTSCARCQSMIASIARADDTDRSLVQREPARRFFWIPRVLAPAAMVGVVIAIAIGVRSREQRAPEVIALASPAVSGKLELAQRAVEPPPEIASQAKLAPEAPSAPPAAGVAAPRAAAPAAHHHSTAAERFASPPLAIPKQARSLSAPAQPPNIPAEESRAMRAQTGSADSTGSPAAENLPPATAALEPLPGAAPSARAEIGLEKSAPPLIERSSSMPAASSNAPAQAQNAPAQEAYEMKAPSAAMGSPVGGETTMMAKAPETNQIASPDGSVVWQFGSGGTISRSGNSSPWLTLRSGVTTDLLAASAPSNDVCWIAGKSGTIVRTLDGGAHLQLIKPPARENFTAISATDSNNAIVSAASGQRFITHDGGVTWSSP